MARKCADCPVDYESCSCKIEGGECAYEKDNIIAVSDNGKTVKFEEGSLAEFAISHGCDFMDMSTMTTYRGI